MDFNTHEDYEIVDLVARGDQAAFQWLFNQHMSDIFKFCYSLLLDQNLAEDAVQEVFTKLWVHAKDWKPEAKLKTWLVRLARNHCLDVLRKKKNDVKKNHALYKDTLSSHDNVLTIKPEEALDQEKHRKRRSP